MSPITKNTVFRPPIIGLFLLLLIAIPAVVSAGDTYFYVDDSPLGGWTTTVINSPGTWILMNDVIDYAGPGPVIIIAANDVVLDGNGHSLDGFENPSGIPCVNRNYPVSQGIVVAFGSQRVHIKDLTINQFRHGIWFIAVNQGLIQNVDVAENEFGIELLGSNNIDVSNINADSNYIVDIFSQFGNNNAIHDNTLTDNQDVKEYPTLNPSYGIFAWGELSTQITDNSVSDTTPNTYQPGPGCGCPIPQRVQRIGIYYRGLNGLIDNNDLSNCQNNIFIDRTSASSITENEIRDNTDTSGQSCGVPTFYDDITMWGSPSTPFWPGNVIKDNTIVGNAPGEEGIILNRIVPFAMSCHHNLIDNNSVTTTDFGIELFGCGPTVASGQNTIVNNTVTDGGYGIILAPSGTANSNYNTITNNIVEDNSFDGISLIGVSLANPITGNTIDKNRINRNDRGIFLWNALVNLIDGNQIHQNVKGIHLWLAQQITVINNVITSNTGSGLHLEQSQLNTIYNNCFNNTYNAAFDPIVPGPNNWNTLMAPGPNIVGGKYFGGNYWAKPDGTGHSQIIPPNADEFTNQYYPVNGANNIDYFPLWNPLNASFTYTPSSGFIPLTVQFTDTSTGNPTCWYWDLDDDGVIDSRLQDPTFTYTAEGSYNITLTISRCSVEGCAANSTYIDPIIVGPHADFSASPVVGPAPLIVSFIDESVGTISAWAWDFDNNGTVDSTDQNPIYQYHNPGLYTVNLTVTGSHGTYTEIKTDYIDTRTPFEPVADFTASPQSGDAPLTVNFIDLSSGNVTSWSWDFDDGSPIDTTRNPSHTFSSPGVYTVELTVTNTGGSDTQTLDITATTPGLAADFKASPQFGDVPLTVDFIDLSTGNITSWSWDFGDGSAIDITRSPSHTYTAPGDYTVTLTVTDAYGSSAKSVVIHASTPIPVANFMASPRTGYTNLKVYFYDLSTGVDSSTEYYWTFGDGGASTERNPEHTYASEGIYDVHLWVTNPGPPGFEEDDDILKEDYIEVSPEPIPVANILPTTVVGDMPLTIDFEGMSPTYTPTTWLWNFGDGTSANQQNVSHTFTEPGFYDVTLRVFDEQGRGTQDKVTIEVDPVANFVADPASGTENAPVTVQFTDTSSGNPDYFEWSFTGAWIDSYQENPTHTYQDPGTYNVWHRVRANGAMSDWIINQYSVGSTPAIIANPTSGPVPLTVDFEGSSGGYPVDWLWEYGDLLYDHGQYATHTYTDTGIYTVTLTAYYNDRDPVSTTTPIEVDPVADFTMTPSVGNAPLTVQFTDESLGTISAYSWWASDGWTTSVKNPSYTFTQSGTYLVKHGVETPEGLYDESSQYINVYPTADFTWYPSQGDEPLTVQFIDTSLGGGILSTWDFGDGTSATFYDEPGQSAPVHVYEQLGSYEVTLTRMGYNYLPDYITKTVNLMERPPVADFTASPRSGSKPLTVDFIDQSSGEPTDWYWDFNNDGIVDSTSKNPSYTYSANGDYTVKLTVTNAGGSDSETKAAYIRVSDVPLPVAEFTASPIDGRVNDPMNVQFKDTSMNAPTSWLWNFGDGTTSNLQSPMHTYTTPGWYTVTLTVSNAQGQNSIIKSSYIYVRNAPPVAAFDASPRSGDAPLTVQFDDHSTGLGITSWQWNFGDGGTSTTQSPLYVYNTAGTYTVSLTVSNDGGSDSEVKTSYITVNPAPPANIIKLYPGWNFVSVPKRLASGHNTAIQVFGSVDLGGRAILLWDADAGMWKQVMAGDVLQPLNGYWVYSVTRIDVPLTFDTVTPPSPTSKSLYSGWNAIGYAGTTSMSARNFLTVGGQLNGNWDILLGFHDGIIPDTPIIRDSNDGLSMYPTKGYWIAMSTDDTLTVVV